MAADVLHYLGQVVDRLVGVFDPNAGLSRHRTREMLARAYEGASTKDGWRPRRPGASANADHRADATTLRARSRALVQNVPYIANGLRSLVSHVVGTGITPRWIGKDANVYDELWKAWGAVCDADGRHDIYGLQAAAYRAMQQDGEVLIRLRPRLVTDGLPVPLQLQLLEIDWLDSSKTGPRDGNHIINGIEYDFLGRVAGYWLFDAHPGETSITLRRPGSRFVPATNIIHLYTADRPGQGRGFPRISPVVARVRDLQLYEDAELQRKNLETRLSVLASGNPAEMANPPSPGEPVDTNAAKDGDLGPLQSGGITQVPTGMSLTVVEPKAAGGYVEYVKYQLHLIAAGFGVTYAMMTGDTKGGSFSSERASRLNFQKDCEFEQWVVFIPKFCDRVCKAFADAAELAGLVRKANYTVEHSTPKWDYVNPKDDVDADLNEIAGGLSSFSEKLRKRGYKPDQVFDELRTDIEKLRGTGVLDVMLKLLKGKSLEGEDAAGAAAERRANDRDGLLLRAIETNTQALNRLQPPQVHTHVEPARAEVHNHVEPARAEVHNHVQPARAEVHNHVEPARAEVHNHVTPSPVEVRNEITAQAGETQVVVAHPQRSETTYSRDPATQEITGQVTTFKTADQ